MSILTKDPLWESQISIQIIIMFDLAETLITYSLETKRMSLKM